MMTCLVAPGARNVAIVSLGVECRDVKAGYDNMRFEYLVRTIFSHEVFDQCEICCWIFPEFG